MKRKPKQLCMFCQKKFKNVRKHDKWCKARQKTVYADPLIQEQTNFESMSPSRSLDKGC